MYFLQDQKVEKIKDRDKDSKDKKEDSQIKIPDDTTYYKREIIHGCGSINIMIG